MASTEKAKEAKDVMTNSPLHRLTPGRHWPTSALHDTAASRLVEASALASVPAFTLMTRAGQAVACLTQALVPHARSVWVAAGPGHNGGDGMVAATHLHRAGWSVTLSLLAPEEQLPPDARRALAEAQAAGVRLQSSLPAQPADVLIDALLGLGQSRAADGFLAAAVDCFKRWENQAHVVAVDQPTGLCGNTGRALGSHGVQADDTLCLLTLKPGLFTADGRDRCGRIWWTDLGASISQPASAMLTGPENLAQVMPRRRHAQHKGSFGDLWVVGAADGMQGAGLLAARAGLQAGAGRVFLAPLATHAMPLDPVHPELMLRTPDDLRAAGVPKAATVVCGCGGGAAVHEILPALLSRSARLVLDADALNAVAQDPGLARQLQARRHRGQATVLTPHPLEASRLLGCDAATVQADRLNAAQTLAQRFQSVILLKGSGSIVARPGGLPFINSTGNARLATPGSGDVLAGWLGGWWAAQPACSPDQVWPLAARVAAASAWLHGMAVEDGHQAHLPTGPLTASPLIEAMCHTAATAGAAQGET